MRASLATFSTCYFVIKSYNSRILLSLFEVKKKSCIASTEFSILDNKEETLLFIDITPEVRDKKLLK
jgi:hypothetical protein